MLKQSSQPLEDRSPFTERRTALVIGVNNAPYSDKGALKNAVADAEAMASALELHCGFNIIENSALLNEEATSIIVKDKVRDLVRDRKDDDFLLFYFSGHGIPMPLQHNREDVYLATHDFKRLDVNEDEERHVSFKWLWERLYQGNTAGKVVLILDCCYSGNMGRYGPDLNMGEIISRLSEYFNNLNFGLGAKLNGLRQTLAATGYNMKTNDNDGRMTALIVPTLTGQINDAINSKNQVTLYSLREYLSSKQRPSELSGSDASRDCILAYHSKHPNSYFPYGPDPLFRSRENEFEKLDAQLCATGSTPTCIGLIGMGGVGKSQLAKELVCRNRAYFTDGVFWTAITDDERSISSSTEKVNQLVRALAILAQKTGYLPPGEDVAHPNEEQRARYFCRFLAGLTHALLILDNLYDLRLLTEILPDLAGVTLKCTVLYTSRNPFSPTDVIVHQVLPLNKEKDLLFLLLEGTRSDVLKLAIADQSGSDVEAALSICRRIGGLPLALILLRAHLLMDDWLTLPELDQEMEKQGVLAIADTEETINLSLYQTFMLSWRRVNFAEAQQMFKLAAYFPTVATIPLWLLSLAVGIEEKYTPNSLFVQIRHHLRQWGLIEDIPGIKKEIQIHPLLREFGQRLVREDVNGLLLLREAAKRVVGTFVNMRRLEQRARDMGYWSCLEQIHAAGVYVLALDTGVEAPLLQIEKYLDHETFFLGTSGLWPDRLPNLFYQQMHNRFLEEGQTLLSSVSEKGLWLRQVDRVGIEDKTLLKIFSGHSAGITSVAISLDGTRVLTGSEDMTARIFDAVTSKQLVEIKGHSEVINCVAFSPDGSHALTGSRDHSVRLWQVDSGTEVWCFNEHTDWVNGIAFLPDNTGILTGSQDGTVCLVERSTGILRSRFNFNTSSPKMYIHSLWEEENELALSEEDGANPDAVTCISSSPDGSSFLVGFADGSTSLHNIATGTKIATFAGHQSFIMSVAFSPDGSQVLTASADATARIWKIGQIDPIATLRGHTEGVTSAAFSPDGSIIVTGSWDRTTRLWQNQNGTFYPRSQLETQVSPINSVIFSPSGLTILIGSSDGNARLLDIFQEQLVGFGPDLVPENSASYQHTFLTSVAFSSTASLLLAAYSDRITRLWERQSGKVLAEFPNTDGEVLAVAIAPNNAKLFTGTSLGSARVWDTNNQNPQHILAGHTEAIMCAIFSPDGQRILTGSMDMTARLWDAARGRIFHLLKAHLGEILSVAFSPDGLRLLTGSRDGTARLWTWKQKRREFQRTSLSGHQGAVLCVAFSPDGTKVFTGSTDTLLRVWNAENGKLLTSLDGRAGPVGLITCSPNGKYILTGSVYDQVRLWGAAEDPDLYRLVGAYATNSTIRALHWQDEQHVLLVDDVGFMRCPRVYTLCLEGFQSN